jgi:hypothetical protein
MYVPTHLTAQSILVNVLVDTSCNVFCQFSKPISESEAHHVIILQPSTPSAVGLT